MLGASQCGHQVTTLEGKSVLILKYRVALLLILAFAPAAFTQETVDEDINVQNNNDDPEDASSCRLIRRLWTCSSNCCLTTWDFIQDMLDKVCSPKGAMVVACAYGVSQGISNFLWAFNWQDHAGASEETSKIIQEIGGLSSSAECFIIGALVPVMLYKYNKHVEKERRRALKYADDPPANVDEDN